MTPDALRAAARRFGTPVYVTSAAALDDAAAELRDAFPDPWLRAYSVKANDVPAIIARLGAAGLGANVVSSRRVGRGTAGRASRNDRITLEGIGKTAADLRAAVRAARDGDPLRWVAVESPEEVAALLAIARRAGLGTGGRPPLDVLLRLNPDVTPETHAGLAVGRGTSKFGMTETELTARRRRDRRPTVHSGRAASTSTSARSWARSTRGATPCAGAWRCSRSSARAGDGFDTFDVGGGFPVGDPGTIPTPAHFGREVQPLLDALPPDRRPARLAVEPGRFLVAGAGRLVARVLHVRERAGAERVVVLDAGMTELIRPALYGATHPVVALTSLGRPLDDAGRDPSGTAIATATARVDGPICESTDTLDTPRPAPAPPRRPRRDRRGRGVRRVDGDGLQRAPGARPGAARGRRHAHRRPASRDDPSSLIGCDRLGLPR